MLCIWVTEVIHLFSQLLVQAEVHPHYQYVNVPDLKSPSVTSPAAADSPPNTITTASAHTNNTSPSLAEATVSDNESFTLHSSGLPTPDTPLLLYKPLLDEETCSNSSTTNTPDYDPKLTPSPATPGSTKYHRLGAPSLSPSPTPTPRLTPNLDGENSYENMLTQAAKCGGVRYENVLGSVTNVDMSDVNDRSNGMAVHDSKYVNMIGPVHTEENKLVENTSPLVAESQATVRYENVPSRRKDRDVYESIADDGQRLPHDVAPEPANTARYEEDCNGLQLSPDCKRQQVYQNVPNSSCDEEHLYEDVQVRSLWNRTTYQQMLVTVICAVDVLFRGMKIVIHMMS